MLWLIDVVVSFDKIMIFRSHLVLISFEITTAAASPTYGGTLLISVDFVVQKNGN